jgi:hypothetical protein
MSKAFDLKDFAQRVERLCDFILDRTEERNGSTDLRVIEDLKQEAADIQFEQLQPATITVEGLSDYMKGAK